MGNAKMKGVIYALIGGVVVIFLVSALAPDVFQNLTDMNASVPTWVKTALTVITGAGLIFLIWRAVAE